MKKALAIGCGIFLAFLLMAGIAVFVVYPQLVQWLAPKAIQWVQQKMVEEAELHRIIDEWQPPAKDAPPAQLFPAKVREFQLDSHDEKAAIPKMRIDQKGRHAVYREGGRSIEVFVYQMNEAAKEALFTRVNEVYEAEKGNSGVRSLTRADYRLYYSSPDSRQNHLWYSHGWLWIYCSPDEEDHEPFIKDHFRATSAKGQGKN